MIAIVESYNHCRCGNRPELVVQTNGLVRVACVLSRCNEIVCGRPDVARAAWNELNPSDDTPTLPSNPVPKAEPYRGAWTHARLEGDRPCIPPPVMAKAPTVVDIELPKEWSE